MSVKRYTNHSLATCKQRMWVVTPSSATSPRWGQADNTQGKYDLISQAENHRAYFGATLNFAASDKHNIIQ